MDYSKKEAATPRQVAQRARDSSSRGNISTSRDGVTPLQGSSAPNPIPRRSNRPFGSQNGSSPSLSPSVLDFARRTQIEAQAQRTSVKIGELERETQDAERDEATVARVKEELPVGPVYPGTVARKNVTVRRSRDRLSGRSLALPRTPEDVLRRRSLDHPRDKRSDEQEQHVTQGASTVTHIRKHVEALEGSYRVFPYSQTDPDAGFRSADGTGRPSSSDREDHRRPYLSDRPVPREYVARYPWGGSKSPTVSSDDEDDQDGHHEEDPQDEGEDEDDQPLFLRRDIPSILDAPEIYEELLSLWQSRQHASQHLVKALDEDDSNLFGQLETTMRQLNKRMHQVLSDYRDAGVPDRGERTYIDVDSLPIPPDGSQSSRSPGVPSSVRPDDARDQMIGITFDYKGNQVYRRVTASSSNLNIHHSALDYLMEVFDKQVTNFADVILTCYDQEVPLRGSIVDIPIVDGSTVIIAFRSRGNRTPGFNTTNRVLPSCPGGSSRGYQREESHSLTSARASSQPGNNGEAYPRGSPQGYQREESHSLTSARASSRPGNNGEAFSDAPHDDYHPVQTRPT
jgi:hypothetical protein